MEYEDWKYKGLKDIKENKERGCKHELLRGQTEKKLSSWIKKRMVMESKVSLQFVTEAAMHSLTAY